MSWGRGHSKSQQRGWCGASSARAGAGAGPVTGAAVAAPAPVASRQPQPPHIAPAALYTLQCEEMWGMVDSLKQHNILCNQTSTIKLHSVW